MTVQEILSLSQAGFNAQQIAALNAQAQQIAALNTQAQNVYGNVAYNQQAQPGYWNMANNPFTNLSNQLQQLNTNMQMAQIQQSAMPQQQTTDDILAEIINPPKVMQMVNTQQYAQMPTGAPMAVPNSGGNK